MTHDSQPMPPVITEVSVAESSALGPSPDEPEQIVSLLREMVASQERQNELLEELVQQTGAAQRQRATELGQWKQANPALARSCRVAAETLGRVQTQFLEHLTNEVHDSVDNLLDGEFMLHEFVDRFGPRLAHLNGVLQVLSQLSSNPGSTKKTKH